MISKRTAVKLWFAGGNVEIKVYHIIKMAMTEGGRALRSKPFDAMFKIFDFKHFPAESGGLYCTYCVIKLCFFYILASTTK